MKASCFISLGSNLGDRAEYINKAIRKIDNHPYFKVLLISSFLETKPQEMLSKNLFINCAIKVETNLPLRNVLPELFKIETFLSRPPESKGKNLDRTIDLDLLFYNNTIINTDEIVVPHPKLHNRYFVLKPLCEIAADFKHPVLNKTIQTLLNELNEQNNRN